MLTLTEVQATLPTNHRANITQDMVDQLNKLSSDPNEAKYIRDNFISFASVLQEGRFRIGDYVAAVMYVSHKVMGKTNLEAYKLTFPQRYADMVKAGKEKKDIASFVTAYNKGMLVTKIMEQAIVPSWILNNGMFQEALNTQYELMQDVSVSDKVRCEAANSLLTHLKKPEAHKAEVKIDIAVNDGLSALEDQLVTLSAAQLKAIEDKQMSSQDVASLPMKTVN